eukprot:12703104-Heterocapsa_arctica.AAC.1
MCIRDRVRPVANNRHHVLPQAANQQILLIYLDEQLEDDERTLSSYDIQNDAVLILSQLQSLEIQIFVKSIGGKTFVLEVNKSDN